jgi:pullulanase
MANLIIRNTLLALASLAIVGCGGGGGDSSSVSADDLDAKYDYTGELGVTYDGNIPTLRVWAPTADSVSVKLYATSTGSTVAQTVAMTFDDTTGVWSATGDVSWTGMYYLYYVDVGSKYHVTDPYSVSLSTDSKRSQVIDLDDDTLKPADWDALGDTTPKPTLTSFTDMVIYELHIRDFSANDTTVSAEKRGKFTAFTETNSNGINHLKRLKEAGVTHIHLLPAFDFDFVYEDESDRTEPSIPSNTSGASGAAASIVKTRAYTDAFNWGYDPLHYGVPEGSYASDPDGATRIREFREMVQAINGLGLRVVMDVVYNHTSAKGASSNSVFDKIVPNYYYRGTSDSCCPDTASEHEMMEKLMIDTLVRWATAYKVDGFRFDLMGFHPKQTLLNIRAALDALTVATNGVDGTKIYIYGEGWDFGAVKNNALFTNATQLNMADTGIGTFNDRLRDAIRGGSPVNSSTYQTKGFGNAEDYTTDTLLYDADLVRIGMAASLQDYSLVEKGGTTQTGINLPYNGQLNAGYAKKPTDVINYVSAHDNETLFDVTQIKASSSATLAERLRMHVLAESIVALSQGIPFFHAGDELLRSKSMDKDSYNSSDWFNRIDFSYQTNNWAVGLPPEEKNSSNYSVISPLLTNAALAPDADDITASLEQFEEFLKIRRDSKLFRLDTADDIKTRVKFYNTGSSQTAGLIVMSIDDDAVVGLADLDPAYSRVVVAINATGNSINYSNNSAPWFGSTLALHPCLAASSDATTQSSQYDTGTFTIPGRTTAVFVQVQEPALAVCD